MSTQALFRRQFALIIGERRIETDGDNTLRVDFSVTRTLSREPNKADIAIHNLREETRSLFQRKNQRVILEAGYIGNTSVIFRGTVTNTDIERQATGWITRVECADGGTNSRRTRINRSVRGSGNVGDIAREVVRALGVGDGNIADLPRAVFQNGFVVSGRADQQLEKVARKARTRYSIQDGQAVFLGPEQVRRGAVPLISAASGLIGTPQVGEQGFVTLTSQIQPNLTPGYSFRLESRLITGFYRVEKATYRGDSWGNTWAVELEGKPL